MNRFSLLAVSLFLSSITAFAQAPTLMGIGDSLGEGDQSANAFSSSQQAGYLNLVAGQMRASFPLPLIQSSSYGIVGSVLGRSRLDLTVLADDVAVSGANTSEVLHAGAGTFVRSETDLVLTPTKGQSQVQIVASRRPALVYCWVGNDDLTPLILDFTHLDNPTGVTSLATFTTEFQQLMAELQATGSRVLVANIPDITQVGFLFDNDYLTAYTGTNYNLPTGYVTTLGAVVLLKLGVLTGADLSNPAYVLSPAGIANIQNQVDSFNQVIAQAAASAGFPLVDAHALFAGFISNPVTIAGVTLNTNFNGGAFSLDGLHPSNTGYAFIANEFINITNQAFGSSIPVLSGRALTQIAMQDPFIDFTASGKVPGRPQSGLLETLAPLLGFSTGGRATVLSNNLSAAEFMSLYYQGKGLNPNQSWQKADVINAVREMLGAR